MGAGTAPSTLPDRSSSDRDAALAELIRARREAASGEQAIEPRDPAVPRRLSYQQERLFALDQIVDELLAYNQAQAFRVRGRLDLDAFDAAVQELQLRHEILRTRVRLIEGTIAVEPIEPGTVEWLPVDTGVGPGDLDDAFVRDLVTEQVRRPLPLTTSGPLRISVLELADDDHVLVVSLHHIACDDVTKRVVFDDLSRLYENYLAGPAPAGERPRLQFSDYAQWQRARLEDGSLAPEVAWWTQYLENAPVATTLPLDRPRPLVATNIGAKHRARVPEPVMRRIREQARSSGATPFMVLLAGFAWLLEQFGNDGEVVLGTPASGRSRDELRSMVGLFLNTLPVRVETRGNPTFAELVERVRASMVGVLGHQDIPFELILDIVRPERDPSHSPLFQVMFTVRGESATNPRLGTTDIEPIGYDGGWTKFDLGLTCLTRETGDLDLLWQYNTGLFDPATIESLGRHLVDLLSAASAAPDRPLGEVTGPVGHELEQVLHGWNDTDTTGVPDVAVHRLVEAQVDRTPTAIAVRDADGAITYAELDERANQLAHELTARGVGLGDIVAIAVQRSVTAEVAVLGVLKAGAAYLPIDAHYPAARLEFLLRDSAAQLVLVDRASAGSIPLGTTRIVLDRPDAFGEQPCHRPNVEVGPEDLAYVIYTSGSTGQPKGVLCEHRGLVNRLTWMAAEYNVGPADVLLQKTPLTFDVSVWEVLLPLITGATLVMAAPERHGDPAYLREVIAAHGVSVIHFVPSMLAAFLLSTAAGDCPSLRMVATSGEALPLDTAAACWRLLPDAELHNLYGPTEASIDVTATRCRPGDEHITIGRPIANMRVYVLDPQGRPVPVGAPGELYLAGVGVARGYLNRDDLTAERFLPDPFTGRRMYRTGDRARRRRDGTVDYLGRLDDQIKLRGFRIELGEIEAALVALPGVLAAVCDVRGAPEDRGLFGYIVVTPGDAVDPRVVRHQLSRTLPAHEVPTAIGIIETVPVSANGKADRRALPDLRLESSADTVVGPRDAIEKRVAAAWAAVLTTDAALSVHDNFFDVGGHSLSALRLFAALEKSFRIPVPLSMMISGVTIADIAEHIRQAQAGDDLTDMLVAMRPEGTLPPLFAMPGLRGDVLVYRQMLAELDARRPVYGVQCRGIDGRVAPRTTIREIAADCVLAMRTRQPHGPYHVFGYCFSGIIAYEVAHQLTSAGETVDFVGIIDATPPRGVLPTAVNGKLRRRLHLLTDGGVRAGIETVRAFARRRGHRMAAVLYARLGRRIPPRFVDFYYANRMAQLSYVPPPADVRVSLIRRASETSGELVPQDRWAQLAARGMDVVLLDASEADHHKLVQSRFASQVSHAINDAVASAVRWNETDRAGGASARGASQVGLDARA